MLSNVRLIVLNYKRFNNVFSIINGYRNIMPITVINNNNEDHFPYLGQPIDVINNETNWMCMERWHRCFEYDEEFKLVIDDDLLPHPNLVEKMMNLNLPITGIYGKTKVSSSNSYQQLLDHWCEDKNVDFLVGSVILVKQEALDSIRNSIEKIGYPKRGDDIIISYLIKKKYNLDFLRTVSGKVLNLPEGDVGLNKNPDHYSMRWNIIEKFKNNSWTDNESIVQ